MKAISKYLAIAAVAVMAVSCQHNVTMGTIINEDGTCHREIIFKADSSNIVDGYVHSGKALHLDSTWTHSCGIEGNPQQLDWPLTPEQYDSLHSANPDKKFFVRYTRDFASVDEMCNAFPYKIVDKQVIVTGTFEKKNRWLIFNEYTYTETYRNIGSEFNVPVDSFMTSAEAQIWTTGHVITTNADGTTTVDNVFAGRSGSEIKEQLDEIEIKVSRWVAANNIDKFCSLILDKYDSIPSVPVSREEFCTIRTNMIQDIQSSSYTGKTELSDFLSNYVDPEPYTDYISELKETQSIHVKTTGSLDSDIYSIFSDIQGMSIDYNLKLPGEMLSAGTGAVKDGLAQYRLTGDRLIPGDYVITATSRKLNLWAIIIVVAIALGSTIAVRLKRK